MKLNKLQIGERIRKIREEKLKLNRNVFSEMCQISPRQLGKIERGECLISLQSLNNIVSITGTNIEYILYGTSSKSLIKDNLKNIINHADNKEIHIYYNAIFSMHSYIEKMKK